MADETTTIRVPTTLRNRLKALAAIEGINMQEWIEKIVQEKENER